MSTTHDFSRRFFADFIASRIKAWNLEESGSQPASQAPEAVRDGDPTRVETGNVDTASIDEPHGLLPGLGSSAV
jgi:hypothetical protein